MPATHAVPEASLDRLALYHCHLGQLIAAGAPPRITSRELAEDLDLKDETVRRDISFVGGIGRPGAGYDPEALYRELSSFLGLVGEYPIIMVGTLRMLEALEVVFPAQDYGVRPVAYFSEDEADEGWELHDITVRHLARMSEAPEGPGADVALVACSTGLVQEVIDALAAIGVHGVLLLTAAVHVDRPEGMTIHQVRMPCDIKTLACRCQLARHGAGR